MKKILIKIMNFLMLDCNKATFLVSKKLDDRLDVKEKIQLNAHLSYCNYCNKFEIQSKKIDEIIKITPEKMEKMNFYQPRLDKKFKVNLIRKLKSQ